MQKKRTDITPPPPTMFNGAELHRLRRERSWSLEELSERSGVSVSHISQLEKGTRKSPSVDRVYRLAEALSVSMYSLLGRAAEESAVPSQNWDGRMQYGAGAFPSSSGAPSEAAETDGSRTWATRRVRPEILAFVAREDSEEYIQWAQALYEARDSYPRVLEIVGNLLSWIGKAE